MAADLAGSKRAMAYALCKHLGLDPVIPRPSSHRTLDSCSVRLEAKALTPLLFSVSFMQAKADFLMFRAEISDEVYY